MKKIPTLFLRQGKPYRATTAVNPGCEWVLAGEGKATVKHDGTACMIRDGRMYARREIPQGKPLPTDFILEETRADNGKRLGWVEVDQGSEFKYHREAFMTGYTDGTYELVGPKVQGNPHGFSGHILLRHGADTVKVLNPSFETIRQTLEWKPEIEGIVWHHPDGRMAKIKQVDFGLPWPPR